MNKEINFATKIMVAMEESEDLDPISDDNATEFFTGMLLAFACMYGNFTGEKKDLIDIISVANRLAFQHVLKGDGGSGE